MGYLPGQREAIGQRQASQYYYYGGMDHFDASGITLTGDDATDYFDNSEWQRAASEYFNSIGRPQATSPWMAISSDNSRGGDFRAMQEENYNPFIGNEGAWVTPGGVNGQDLRGSIGGTAEGYRDDSIAGWFKGQFAGQDMVQHRRNALTDLNNWATRDRAEDGTSQNINKATTRMSQRAFDEMGLAEKYGLTYDDPRPQEYADAYAKVTGGGSAGGGYMGGSFMDNYNAQRPNPNHTPRPIDWKGGTGGPRPFGPIDRSNLPTVDPDYKWSDPFGDRDIGTGVVGHMQPQVKPGGFMESYLKKKAESKPSVMSLMTELKDA